MGVEPKKTRKGSTALLIEGAKYRSHASLDAFCAKFGNRIGDRFILYSKDLQIKDGIIHLPIYMSMFL